MSAGFPHPAAPAELPIAPADLPSPADEAARRTAEDRYRALVEVSPQVVWFGRADGSITYCNPEWYAYTGLTPAESEGDGWTAAIHPDHRARMRDAWRAAAREAAGGGPGRYEVEIPLRRASDGGYRWFLVRGQPTRDAAGTVTQWVGVALDIDDRRRAEEALARQNGFTRLVAENATSALFFMDADGHPTYMNAAAEAMTGYAHAEIAGLPLHYAVHHRRPDGSPYPMAECPIDRALPEHSNVRAHEDVFIRKDGSYFPVVCAASPILEHGRPVGTVVEVRDVSAERETLAELEAVNAQLREQGLELELSNQQLQEQAAELEAQAEELQATAAHLEEQIEAAERARRELAASDARYQTLLGSIDAGFCVIEVLFDGGQPVDYRFLDTNAAFVRQVGFGEPRGRRMREIAPDLETFWYETYGEVVTTGKPARFRHEAVALGRVYDVFAYRVDDPTLCRVAVLFTDVTAEVEAGRERERLLAALEVERARLEEVFRRAPSFAVVYRGPAHVYEFVNEAYYGLIGHRRVLGRPLDEAVPEAREQGFTALLDQVLATGEPWVGRETPVWLERTAGAARELRYADMVFLPLTEADGTHSGVLAHGVDITEQVLARREIERLLADSEAARREAETERARAVEANQAKSQFLANMSHELRTPLNAIGGYVQLIELGIHGSVNDGQREALGRVQRAQQHLLGLINDVLNYARLEGGRVEYEVRALSIDEALADVAPMIEPQLRARGLAFAVHPPAPGPDGRAPQLRADRDKLRQVLLNLLSNAVKFTEPRNPVTGAPGQVTLAADVGTDGPVRLWVRDTGRGIPADQLAAIFEPFVQVGKRFAGEVPGTGLGLAISRDLARGMGGDLMVESIEGEGSTFTLALPRA